MGLFDEYQGALERLQGDQRTVIGLLTKIAGALDTLALPAAVAAQGSAAAAKPVNLSSLDRISWRLPITLQEFNEVIGMTGYAGQAAPQVIQQVALVPPAASGVPGQTTAVYQVPAGKVAIGFANVRTIFTDYTPDVTLTVFIDEGLTDAVPAAVNLPATSPIELPLTVVGSHPVFNNITGVFVNAGATNCTATTSGTMLLITEQLWRDIYQPFFQFQFAYLKALTAAVTAAQGGMSHG